MTTPPDRTPAEWRALIEAGLVCPFCTATNRPGVTHIELAEMQAHCRVCSKDGPLTEFQPEAH